jgi:hypothetical protein
VGEFLAPAVRAGAASPQKQEQVLHFVQDDKLVFLGMVSGLFGMTE